MSEVRAAATGRWPRMQPRRLRLTHAGSREPRVGFHPTHSPTRCLCVWQAVLKEKLVQLANKVSRRRSMALKRSAACATPVARAQRLRSEYPCLHHPPTTAAHALHTTRAPARALRSRSRVALGRQPCRGSSCAHCVWLARVVFGMSTPPPPPHPQPRGTASSCGRPHASTRSSLTLAPSLFDVPSYTTLWLTPARLRDVVSALDRMPSYVDGMPYFLLVKPYPTVFLAVADAANPLGYVPAPLCVSAAVRRTCVV